MTVTTHRVPTRYARAWGASRDLPPTDRQARSGHCEPEDESGLRGHERHVGHCDVGAYQTSPVEPMRISPHGQLMRLTLAALLVGGRILS